MDSKEENVENRIEKQIHLSAPISKVWHAISDYRSFGEWFRVKLEIPFAPGAIARGKILHPGYEHLTWEVAVKSITPETLFSFTWHPYSIDPKVDYSKETPTLVEFRVSPSENGTLLVLTESGFENVPSERRELAYRMNAQGWAQQMKNVESFLVG
jgi:uncharacterized protein YndB with AHSA1/START domain